MCRRVRVHKIGLEERKKDVHWVSALFMTPYYFNNIQHNNNSDSIRQS